MPQFLYRLQPTRPAMLTDGATETEASVVAEHFEYLKDLTAKGKVLLAGRTLNTDETCFGIVIVQVESEGEAHTLMRGDPAVCNRVMKAELFPYRIALWSTAGPASEHNGA